jgi:predicted restriction endonuclease
VWGLRENQNETPKAKDFPEDIKLPNRKEYSCFRILRDTRVARELKALYRNRCQICGNRIKLNSGDYYSEAHHIIPLGREHSGPIFWRT